MFLRTDEELEAAQALEAATKFAEALARDSHYWRWVILALHNAAQGTMVLTLRHGNGLLALTDESAKAWLNAYKDGTVPPPEKLDSFLNLYRKVKHKEIGHIGGNKRFVPAKTEDADIRQLNSLRNEFIHFTPKSWSLQIDGLPRICLSVTHLVSFLAVETENIFWHSQEIQRQFHEALLLFSSTMRQLEKADFGATLNPSQQKN